MIGMISKLGSGSPKTIRVILMMILFFNCPSFYAVGASAADEMKFTIIPFTNEVLINCENIRGADRYEVQYTTSAAGSEQMSKVSSLTRFEIEGLKPGTLYYFKSRVLNKNRWSNWSVIQQCKTTSFTATIETFNILSSRFDSVFPQHQWKDRKQALADLILRPDNSPDILGVQEANLNSQLKSLDSLINKTYHVHVSKRPISARAIFWKKSKYELVSFDDDIKSIEQPVKENTTVGYISFVRLREKITKKEILIFNLHTPSGNSAVRNMMAKFVPLRIKEIALRYKNAPVVLLGDFNAFPKSADPQAPTASMIIGNNGFMDTYNIAASKKNAFNSTHDRITSGVSTILDEQSPSGSKRIDYIFVYPANIATVSDYRIVIDFVENSGTVLQTPVPSDHRPVRAEIHFLINKGKLWAQEHCSH
ncbi:MAG: hypothetical protein EOO20_17810 [Chryseobacterium sp.]|nr:MAG: hypothetical protein EOO20_17810 [Chryseobacterium sp.]